MILTAAACSSTATSGTLPVVARATPGLAQFMRERVNVPFSFAMIETSSTNHPRRMHKAAGVLRDAARHLMHWSDPPVVSAEGRDVFFAYATDLERRIEVLEHATAVHDPQAITDSLEGIRRTCNGCHHFFRPASLVSRDVLFDRIASELGGAQ